MNRISIILSSLALVVALTAGGAYAASATVLNGATIQNHTIGIDKLTPQAVKQLKGQRGPRGWNGQNGANGKDGKNGVGFAGPAGAAGAAGAPGAPGGFDPSKITYVTGPNWNLVSGGGLTPSAQCPAGAKAIAGGLLSNSADVAVTRSSQQGGSWTVTVWNHGGSDTTVNAYAVCAAP